MLLVRSRREPGCGSGALFPNCAPGKGRCDPSASPRLRPCQRWQGRRALGLDYQWATGVRRGMIVAMKAPAQAARKAIPATGALLLRMADQDSSAVDQTPFTTDWKIAAGIAPSATAWIGPVSERAA